MNPKIVSPLLVAMAISFGISEEAREPAPAPKCTKILNHVGWISPGFQCCIDPYDIEKCVARSVLGDSVYLNPPLKGNSLIAWTRTVIVRDSLRLVDSVIQDGKYLAEQAILDSLKQLELQKEMAQKKKERAAKKWPKRVWAAIDKGTVFIGMTSAQALESWGEPDDINRTISRAGVREQWVYGMGSYLYFEDGILTTIQN